MQIVEPNVTMLLAMRTRTGEKYIFIFDSANRDQLLARLGTFAANPELSFNWYDAALAAKRVRELCASSDRTETF
jgi:hypothetical protein